MEKAKPMPKDVEELMKTQSWTAQTTRPVTMMNRAFVIDVTFLVKVISPPTIHHMTCQ